MLLLKISRALIVRNNDIADRDDGILGKNAPGTVLDLDPRGRIVGAGWRRLRHQGLLQPVN